MKNLRTLSLIVFTATVSASLMYWYLKEEKAIGRDPNNAPHEICANYDGDNMSTLDVDLVHTMVQGYKNNQLDFIKTNPNFKASDDAHSIWFDLETLKKFLYHIENVSKKAKGIPSNKLGVRIYYAAYPSFKEYAERFEEIRILMDDPEKDQYSALHTLVMIPTIENEAGNQLDFNPLDVRTYANGLGAIEAYNLNSPIPIPNSNPNPQTNSIGALSSSDRHTGTRNHGLLIPPAASVVTPPTPGSPVLHIEGF